MKNDDLKKQYAAGNPDICGRRKIPFVKQDLIKFTPIPTSMQLFIRNLGKTMIGKNYSI